MKRREFIKNTAVISSASLLPASAWTKISNDGKLRTAHIGVGGMGLEDLQAMASHEKVEVTALCDVDANNLSAAHKLFPNARIYADYREMMKVERENVDAVVVSTPDHTHAPASLLAMNMGKAVYCQKPLTQTRKRK